MSRLNEAQGNNAIGRLGAGETQTEVDTTINVFPEYHIVFGTGIDILIKP